MQVGKGSVLRDYEDGLAIAPADYTVEVAVKDWLRYGLKGRSDETVATNRNLCETHILPLIGSYQLRDLRPEDIDRWLEGRAKVLSTTSLSKLHSALNRSIKRAMARDKVKRNVVELCSIPEGRPGRQSKALTLAQAEAVLKAAEGSTMFAYVVMSLLTGARTEELRALTWDHVDLVGRPKDSPPVPPYIAVWRSVRRGGDTKTRKSRRTIALPKRCVEALKKHAELQTAARTCAGEGWSETGLVFTTGLGTAFDAANVRRAFRTAIGSAEGVTAKEWTPRELRHSFVSLLSDSGVPVEEISRLVGHQTTAVTELVYRKQIRPVMQSGATAMDQIFGGTPAEADPAEGDGSEPEEDPDPEA